MLTSHSSGRFDQLFSTLEDISGLNTVLKNSTYLKTTLLCLKKQVTCDSCSQAGLCGLYVRFIVICQVGRKTSPRKLWFHLKILKNIVNKFQKSDAFALKQLLESRRQECLGVEDPGHIYFSDFHSYQRTSEKLKADGS